MRDADKLGVQAAPINWQLALNTTSSAIKPYALLRIIGRDNDGAYQVALPNVYGQNDLCANGPFTIPPNGYGQICLQWPASVAYSTDNQYNDAPAAGDIWGARPGYAELYKQYPGFKVIDSPDTTLKIVVVQPTYDYSNALVRTTGTRGGTDNKLWDGYLRWWNPIDNTFVDGEQVWWRDPNE